MGRISLTHARGAARYAPGVERVLVTGATGFIGYEVARQLSARGSRPRLLVRRPERAALLEPLDAERVQGDLRLPASLTRAVEGVDTVIHLGARAAFERYERLRPTIVDGSLALMRAACEAGVERFVFASSLLVYGEARDPIDAQTAARPVVDYGRAKVEAEVALARLAEAGGVAFSAVRLPHVYGARSLLFERVHRGLVVFPGRGRNVYAHLHVEDAARVLLATAEKGWQGVSPVADRWSSRWNEYFAILRQHYRRFHLFRVPSGLARFGARVLEPWLSLRAAPALVTPDTVVGWNLNHPVSPDTLWGELGLTPRHPTIERGIPAALDECVAFRWRHPLADRS